MHAVEGVCWRCCNHAESLACEQVYKRVDLARRNEEYQVWGEFDKEPSGVHANRTFPQFYWLKASITQHVESLYPDLPI